MMPVDHVNVYYTCKSKDIKLISTHVFHNKKLNVNCKMQNPPKSYIFSLLVIHQTSFKFNGQLKDQLQFTCSIQSHDYDIN